MLTKHTAAGLLFLLTIQFLSSPVEAANDVFFTKEYRYQASEIDSKVSSRAIALEQVKRLLLEELGTYLEAETEVKDFQLTKDQIVVMTAGIVSAEVLQEKWDGETYYLKARIKADPTEVAKAVTAVRENKRTVLALEESRARAGEALKEIARLKKEIETLRTDSEKRKEYAEAVTKLSAAEWYDRGKALQSDYKNKEAIAAFTRAIELSPDFSDAYLSRGFAYRAFPDRKADSARDFGTGIRLLRAELSADPKNSRTLLRLGSALFETDQRADAVNLYNKTLEADPTNLAVRNELALFYRTMGNFEKSVEELRKAVAINPKDAVSYFNLGAILLYNMRDGQGAMQAWENYLKLEPTGPFAERIRNQINSQVEAGNAAGFLSGKVAEAMSAGEYMYIALEIGGKKSWIAAPKSAIKVGQRVSCLPGSEMTDYTVKALNHTFASVIFCEDLRGN